jgi:hypothetical protein
MAKDTITRSIKVDLFCPKDQYQVILNSIRKYRAIARQMFCISAMAEISGGSVNPESGTITPNSEQSKMMLETVFGKIGKAHLYEMRDFVKGDLAPEWLSFVWDSLRTTVSQRWQARDPSIKATRGYLVDQGARSLGFFRNIGIGFPQATGRPKIEGHSIILKWTHDLGEISFNIAKLDPGRYFHFKNIREKANGYVPGTFFLSEKEGKPFILLTYTAPAIKKDLDPEKVLEVRFKADDINAFCLIGSEVVSAREAVRWLSELKHISDKFSDCLASTGNPRKPWGNRRAHAAVSSRLSKVTTRRLQGEKVHNHLWSRRIVSEAIKQEAGIIKIFDIPEKEFFGHPWGFAQLKTFIDYKISEIGGKTVYIS